MKLRTSSQFGIITADRKHSSVPQNPVRIGWEILIEQAAYNPISHNSINLKNAEKNNLGGRFFAAYSKNYFLQSQRDSNRDWSFVLDTWVIRPDLGSKGVDHAVSRFFRSTTMGKTLLSISHHMHVTLVIQENKPLYISSTANSTAIDRLSASRIRVKPIADVRARVVFPG